MLTRTTHVSWKLGLLAIGLLLALSPAPALAGGSASAVLYEVREVPPPRPSTGGNVGAFVPDPPLATVNRLATALEAGLVLSSAGSLASWTGAEVEIHAQSRVDLVTGSGPINGVFLVDTLGGKGSISGKISGTLNLSMILAGTAPLAPTGGSWETLGKASSRLAGTFEGVAQVPVDCGILGGGSPIGVFCYLKPDMSGVDFLQANEFKNGVPLVRFLITFTADP